MEKQKLIIPKESIWQNIQITNNEPIKAKTINVATFLEDSPIKTKISETSPNK